MYEHSASRARNVPCTRMRAPVSLASRLMGQNPLISTLVLFMSALGKEVDETIVMSTCRVYRNMPTVGERAALARTLHAAVCAPPPADDAAGRRQQECGRKNTWADISNAPCGLYQATSASCTCKNTTTEENCVTKKLRGAIRRRAQSHGVVSLTEDAHGH